MLSNRIFSFVVSATAAAGVAVGTMALAGSAIAHVLALGIAGVFSVG